MPEHEFGAADWARALTLAERAALFRKSAAAPAAAPGESERAEYHLECWSRQSPFSQGDWLDRRLALEGLDRASFARLVHICPADLLPPSAPPPEWVAAIRESYSPAECPGAGSLPLPESFRKDSLAGFLNLVAPLLRRALERLRAGIAAMAADRSDAPLEAAELERLLFASLPFRVLWMLDRTLVLELNVARLEDRLPGTTPEERFAGFVDRLRLREPALGILREYPVLARQVAEAADRWVVVSLELLSRLRSDWPAIRSTFFEGREPGRLAEVDSGAGDTHREGRAVAILRFESGEQLVYKPRSLSVDVHFQELLEWLSRVGHRPPFRLLKVLDRGSHGWIEFVRAAPCATAEEVFRYHRRLGGLLAALYAVSAVDFHFENLIAAGEQPVGVDLESLLHPAVPRAESERPDERLAARVLNDSVLRVGMLPFRVGENEGFAGSDLSGVSSVAGMLTPDRMLQWDRTGSDEMTAVRKRLTLKGGKNRPTLEGKEADVADHIGEVAEGFQEGYRLLVRNRRELLSPEGPLARFAGDPIRAVLRSTRGYGLILEESFHPDFLRDALDRDRFFDRLWVGVEEYPAIERIVRFEHRDLWRGDIPYFGARPEETVLLDGSGERVESFFPEPSLAQSRRRIGEMGEEDLFRQAWLTRISLGTLLLNRSKGDWPGFPLTDPGDPGSGPEIRTRLIGAARGLGEWFDRMAVRDAGHLTWVGLDLRNQIWSLYPMPEDLYAGTPGIALFLAYLALLTGEERYAELARRGMGTLLARLRHIADQIVNIGMFQGWGGVVYSLAHLGALWRDPGLLAEAEAMTERIAERIGMDTYLDVVAGSAGGAAALLALHRAGGSRRGLEVARECGERLLDTAKPAGGGVSWHTEVGGDEPQGGFSHGAAGIALVLAELFAVTGDERLRVAAKGGFAFEREWTGGSASREAPAGATRSAQETAAAFEKAMAMSWCYGAPGRGLACLRGARLLADPALREDADLCLALTLESGFGKNHSLCHGDLGNLDLVLQAWRDRPDTKTGEALRRLTRVLLSSVERDGWICGTVANIEAPGLMNGLAGIGYGLLRLADPDRVPSVLTMDGPPAGGR